MKINKIEMTICLGSSCFSRGSGKTLQVINDYIEKNQLEEKIDFRGELCSGNCKDGPNLKIAGKLYNQVDSESVTAILDGIFKLN